jgi:hypothetical protein
LLWGLGITLAITLGLVLLVLGAAWWNLLRMPGRSHRGPLPAADDALLALMQELRRDIYFLAAEIGERNVLRCPKQLGQAADYIESELTAGGYEVRRQRYPVSDVECCNLEVEVPGSARPQEIVVIGAHYDTVLGSPGANDNTSGVAAVLALARSFSEQRPKRTLRFVAFVNEEPPFFQTEDMGSWVYARRCRQRGEKVVAMLSLETIGYYSDSPDSQQYPPAFARFYPSVGNFIGFIGDFRSRRLVRRAIRTFRRNERFPSEGAVPPESWVLGVGLSDQWSFWQEGYPALMVTDTAMYRYPHYHERDDTFDKINFDRLARVVRGLEKVVATLAD